jgi:hypothetical protein
VIEACRGSQPCQSQRSSGQLFLVLLKYIRDNPAKAHEATAILFGHAMKDAFPCPGQH